MRRHCHHDNKCDAIRGEDQMSRGNLKRFMWVRTIARCGMDNVIAVET